MLDLSSIRRWSRQHSQPVVSRQADLRWNLAQRETLYRIDAEHTLFRTLVSLLGDHIRPWQSLQLPSPDLLRFTKLVPAHSVMRLTLSLQA